jgi:hypothetical protein
MTSLMRCLGRAINRSQQAVAHVISREQFLMASLMRCLGRAIIRPQPSSGSWANQGGPPDDVPTTKK